MPPRDQTESQRTWRNAGKERTVSRTRTTATILGIAGLFIGFAALITLAAPLSLLTLRRDPDHRVAARIERRVLWFIPVRIRTLDLLEKIDTRLEHPAPNTQSGSARSGTEVEKPETIGHLILRGGDAELDVMASPVQLDSVAREIREFLNGPELRAQWRLVANWKFSVIIPAIVATPGILLLLLFAWDVWGWIASAWKSRDEAAQE